jgi:hypothetical protein
MAYALLEVSTQSPTIGENVKRIDIMQAPAPDLLHAKHPDASATPDKRRDEGEDACAEAAELEQLAERVSAARSVY